MEDDLDYIADEEKIIEKYLRETEQICGTATITKEHLKSKSLRKLVVAKYRHKNKVEAEAKVQEGKKCNKQLLIKTMQQSIS